MALRGFLLSLALTMILGYSLTEGLTNPNSPLKKLPEWTAIPLLGGIFILYLVAVWWTIQGFSQHKFLSIISFGFCLTGLGVYAFVFTMEMGRGKASPGQYDYDYSTLAPAEKTVLTKIAESANLSLSDATFTEHWNLDVPDRGFRICLQKGHVTALNLSGHPLSDVSLLSQLPYLGELFLKDCGLRNVSGLRSDKIDRLDLSNNQLTDVQSLTGVPNVRWLFLANNQITTLDGFEKFPQNIVKDLTGNPVVK
ncbi:leucine-rich repeat domain-containing protein [Spirosoma sp. BT702]|uniref:Leucine-rich repeat domain-containing protein n=1 Tax=Spirosoma profusum TaxID=2771354 RepID=A0A926Y2C8_9BACT|nr:leucine-rich repeat domain-containing protein [Spirosoma profusum]MBD2702947.1 leucine-rich repeat domain-containing protein [Spirosoma profusum]